MSEENIVQVLLRMLDTPSCPALASMNVLQEGGFGPVCSSKKKGTHVHGPDESFRVVQQLRHKIIKRAKEEPHASLRNIFHEECNK